MLTVFKKFSVVRILCNLLSVRSVMITFLFLSLVGCLDFDEPVVEDITQGSKWNLRIGETCDSVYHDLVVLGQEKKFQSVAIVGRKPFDDIEKVSPYFPYYNWIGFQSTVGQLDRVLIALDSGHVAGIYAGGAMLDSLGHWPDQYEEEDAVIYHGDSFSELYSALDVIQNYPPYDMYQYLLPDKPLNLPFDPNMRRFGQWYFTFQEEEAGSLAGTSQVTLFFEDEELVRIHHIYTDHR